MPPRFAYWTIILEGKPTAFRAHERDDLLPTFKQLQTRHPDVVMKWFARGRLWESPEEAQAAQRGGRERRARDWRPGGEHRDPRARFEVPRDEKRRRFAAKQRRDFRDPNGPPSQAPRDRPPHDRERPERERPREQRSGKAPAWRPPEQREKDRRTPQPEWKDRFDRKPSGPADRPPREGDRRSPESRTAWKPKGPPGKGPRPPFDRDRGGGRPREDRFERRPPGSADRPREGDRRPPEQRTTWKPKGPPGRGPRPPFERDRGGGRPREEDAKARGKPAGKGPGGSKDRFGGQGKRGPDRAFRPDSRHRGTGQKRGGGRGGGGRGGGTGGGPPA